MFTKYAYSRSVFFSLALLLISSLVLTACGPASTPVPSAVPTPKPPPTVKLSIAQVPQASESGSGVNVHEGESRAIVVDIQPYEELDWAWEVSGTSGGSLNVEKGENVVYKAGKAGIDTITARAKTADGTAIKQSVTINVEATPTATTVVTDTPVPTNTPLPPPLVEIFRQVGDGQKFVFKNAGGVLDDKYTSDEICIRSGAYGIWLSYDMKGAGNGGWGVGWNNTPFNAIDFSALTFWVRGINGGENGFQIGIKDADGKEVKVETKDLTVLNSSWILREIPLSEFAPVNLAAVRNINFGFNKDHGSGIICVDEIVFK